MEGTFALDMGAGEQVFLYCFGGSGKIIPLAGISFSGDFQAAALGSYGLGESALPSNLASTGSVTLPHCDEWTYDGPQSGALTELEDLQAAMQDPSQWEGKDCTSSAATLAAWKLSALLVVGLVATIFV